MGDWRYYQHESSWDHYNQMTGGWREYDNAYHQNIMPREPPSRMFFQNQPRAPDPYPWHQPVQNPYSYWEQPRQTPTPPLPSVSPEIFDHLELPGSRSGRQIMEQQKKKKLMRKLREENARSDLEKLQLNADVASTKIELRWKAPSTSKDVIYHLKITDQKDPDITKIECDRTWMQPHYEFKTIAGSTYCIEIKCRTVREGIEIGRVYKEIRAEFNNAEMRNLYEKCVNFLTDGGSHEPHKHEFHYLYRCKPKLYWDEIHLVCNDLMQTYIKDENGQPGNLINGKINGLFFSARLAPDMQLPSSSPFGNVRMVMNANLLLNPQNHNYYFADFYCNALPHYVTIVICVKNSETDRYCKPRLLSLNPVSNPFINAIPPSVSCRNWRFFVNRSVWVEVLFTEDIPLNMGKFDAIFTTGAGTSRLNGLPNNKECHKCNLYPRGLPENSVGTSKEEMELNSTLRIIKKANADVDVAAVMSELIDETCENIKTTEEMFQKSDEELKEAVERMNREIHDKNHKLYPAASSLNNFREEFQRQRNKALELLKKLKE